MAVSLSCDSFVKMNSSKSVVILLSVLGLVSSFGRVHIPWLGLGPTCTGCPQHYCDDDIAIIQGYCCGCAQLYDSLPVRCPPLLNCPANTYSLCQDYEYMMYCCCA